MLHPFSLAEFADLELRATRELLFARPRVAIVGSRAATPEASTFTHELARGLAAQGVVVVSGGAAGIDAAAHDGALAAGGETWAVLPTGPGEVFPKGNEPLFARIAAGPGALIYPFPPGTRAMRHNFLKRNGILVTLADVVVVVQAGLQSGARNAAKWARDADKPLFVVPGPPWDATFAGCLEEIRLGAQVLTSPERVAETLARLRGPLQTQLFPGGARPDLPRAFQGPEARQLWEAIPANPLHADEIIEESSVAPGIAWGLLMEWVALGVLEERPAGFFFHKSLK